MILSRTLARARIAAGQRPSWLAAWLPVIADGCLMALALYFLWVPAQWFIAGTEPSTVVIFLVLFVVFYVPFQAVLILSSVWAAKSRWSDDG